MTPFERVDFCSFFPISGAPKIIKKMDDVEVNINEVIKINTLIEGSPAPDVKW